jgi:hypothetical protein
MIAQKHRTGGPPDCSKRCKLFGAGVFYAVLSVVTAPKLGCQYNIWYNL